MLLYYVPTPGSAEVALRTTAAALCDGNPSQSSVAILLLIHVEYMPLLFVAIPKSSKEAWGKNTAVSVQSGSIRAALIEVL